MTLNLDNVDAYKLAQLRYGATQRNSFPPKQITNLDNFNNLCFSTAAEFVDTNITPLEHSPAGQKCQAAMIDQLKLNGREHPGMKLRLPVVLSKPQYFKNAYLATGNINESYKICANSCILNQSPGLEQTTCIERCGNARDALSLTINPNKQINSTPPGLAVSTTTGAAPISNSTEYPQSVVQNLTKLSTSNPTNILVYESQDNQNSTKNSFENYEQPDKNNTRCGGIIFIIFIIIFILILIGSLIGDDNEYYNGYQGPRGPPGQMRTSSSGQSQLKNAFTSKRGKYFTRSR